MTALKTISIILAAGATVAIPSMAGAQLLNGLGTVRTDQSLVGVAVGNGRVAGQPIVDVQSKGQPLIGVGALSGKKDHFGSAASISVANDARILGIDGPGGVNSANSISIRNPKQAPILSK